MEVINLDDAIVKAMAKHISEGEGKPAPHEIRCVMDEVMCDPAAILTLICEYDLFDRIPEDGLYRFGQLAGSAVYWADAESKQRMESAQRQAQTAGWGYFVFDAAAELLSEMIFDRIYGGGWRPAA